MDEDATLLTLSGLEGSSPREAGNSHVLILDMNGLTERRISLGSDPVLVGRAPPCIVVLQGGSISRQHCAFRVIGDYSEVADLGSTNGTFVNGTLIDRSTTLQHGAIIQVGAYTFRYECRSLGDLKEAQAAEQERQAASRYMQMLLPKPLQQGLVRAEWLFLPCAALGGNAFGYRYLNPRQFAGFMIDVAGHGTQAAMHAVAIMNLLRQQEVLAGELSDPAAVMDLLARSFPPDQHNGLFFSCCYFVIEFETRTLRYAAAGRHPAYLWHPEAGVMQLQTDEPAIGLGETVACEVQSIAAPPGSRLYLLSEGMGEYLDRLCNRPNLVPELIRPGAPGRMPEPSRLYQALQQETGLTRLEDDCSILTCDF